jgi:ABC-2 type transport system permease protein
MWKNFVSGIEEIKDNFNGEIKFIFHDAGAVLIFMIAILIYPLLYSFGYEKETVRELPVAMVDLDHSSLSRQYSRMVDATEQIRISAKPGSLKEAEQLFYDGKVRGVVLVPADFEKNIMDGKQTNITVYSDASFFLLYKQVYAGNIYASGTLGAGVEIKRLLADGEIMHQALDLQDPVKVDVYNLYNPGGGYGTFVMPGMMLIIMQQTLLIGIGLIGGTAREQKKYLKLVGPISRTWGSVRAVLGKSFAYVLIYLFNALYAMILLHKWFAFPDKSGFLPTLFLLIPFLFSVSFLGQAVSVLFRERVHSLLFLVFLSPVTLFVSGLSWPVSSLPPALYWFAHLLPSTLIMPAYIRMRTLGAGLESIHYEWAMLLVQMIVYFIIACISYKIAVIRFGRKLASGSSIPEKFRKK